MFACLVKAHSIPVVKTSAFGIALDEFGKYWLSFGILACSKPLARLCLALSESQAPKACEDCYKNISFGLDSHLINLLVPVTLILS